MNEGGERGYCVLQFIKRLIKADFDGRASRRAVATGEDHPDIAVSLGTSFVLDPPKFCCVISKRSAQVSRNF